ncbi:hypothetical protein AB0N89_40140, partial [Amycolatopsis sp. NPDC089917]
CAAQCDLLVSRKRERSGIAQQVRERLVRLGGAFETSDVAKVAFATPIARPSTPSSLKMKKVPSTTSLW